MKTRIATVLILLTITPLGLSSPQLARAEQPAATRVVTFAIQGMVTPNCPVLVRAAVGKMAGVEKVSASLKTKTATVVYDPDKTSAAKIQAVIKDQVGFESSIVKS